VLQSIDSDLASFYKLDRVGGALVTDVVPDSPAAKAGLKQEDIIVAYNDTPVENLSSFRNAISLIPPGKKVTLKVNREGKEVTLKVTIAQVPEEVEGPMSMFQRLGLQVETLTPELSQKLGYVKEKGVVVSKVLPGSAAEEAGLRPGSLIQA